MRARSKNKAYLYNTRDEIESKSVPYATEDSEELDQVISRFFAWARMIPRYPDVAAKCSITHIQLATDLRAAVKASEEVRRKQYPDDGLYPSCLANGR